MDATAMIGVQKLSETEWNDIIAVCRRIPPVWDLPNYVAVNPFLGFTDHTLTDAARVISDGLGAQVLPPVSYYRSKWLDGTFGMEDLKPAARRYGQDPNVLKRVLDGEDSLTTRTQDIVYTFAERFDRREGTSWSGFLTTQAARWCAVYARGGGAFALDPERGLYETWREAAASDRSPEIAGLSGLRSWISELPESAAATVAEMLVRLRVSPDELTAYLYRLLGGIYGWASYFRRFSWQEGEGHPGLLLDLLAIRLAGEAAVVQLAQAPRAAMTTAQAPAVEDENARMVLQDALEDAFVRVLAVKLESAAPAEQPRFPAVQAVFCIDVRSEPLRRHLEAVRLPNDMQGVETIGFAGFFGIALAWEQGGAVSARCPVLLKPAVTAASKAPLSGGFFKNVKALQGAPSSSFSFVELAGPAYVAGLIGDGLVLGSSTASSENIAAFEFDVDAHKVNLAAGILKNLGLKDKFGRLVLFCGHQGDAANNAHAAALDCGACGGHSGGVNARVAAILFNNRAVRLGLSEIGFNIPDDTCFLAGVHHTSTDEVEILDSELIPQTHRTDVEKLALQLAEAGRRTRQERSAALGMAGVSPHRLGPLLRRRSVDASEVRPEWALARNAAFIAARRARTRGVDLEGRAFLHEYDWRSDHDGAILRLILSAPMVVASWINLQYLASTVDNEVFGCGTKALHNRVESLGVVLGNSGDLRTGLPLQSVHAPDGTWHHEPLRLQVVVESPVARIEEALEALPDVAALVKNGWVRLFALDLDRPVLLRIEAGGWAAH